jgi:rhodanese-related sulfurtransferase
MEQVTYLDAREPAEFDTSHIPGAVFIGFDHWDSQAVQALPKDHTLVVYCSIGYRSEKIAGKLKKMGFQKVYNLYGSIFEWANEGNSLVSNNNTPTLKLHTYNKKWGKWVDNPSIQKVW